MINIIKETDKNSAILAVQQLKNGGIIAVATDTIYGFAVDAGNYDAVEKLYHLKKRDSKKAIAVLFKNLERAQSLLTFSDRALLMARKFLPGPLTMILPLQENNSKLAANLNVADNYIGCRIINKYFINEIFEHFDGDIALTSANLSSQDVYENAQDIYDNFIETELDLLVIDGGELVGNLSSSVVKICNNNVEILRQGAINKEELV